MNLCLENPRGQNNKRTPRRIKHLMGRMSYLKREILVLPRNGELQVKLNTG
jgi:hypothetical protein